MLPFDKDWRAMYGGQKTNYALVCGALLTVGLMSSPAAALQWDLDENDSSKVSQLTFHADGSYDDEIKARGYYSSNNSGSGAFDTGKVQTWSGGIGVFASDDSGSPNHAIDNNGKDNFLLIEFDSPDYLLTAFKIGWYSDDRDVEVWVGGNDLGQGFSLEQNIAACGGWCNYGDLAALGFTKVKVFEDVALNSWTQVNTDVTGRYAIFAGEYGESNDYFKLSGIEGEIIEVPEPGTLALIGTGLLAMGGILRRRRRQDTAAS
jgi:hypothetical protein